uniref:Cytochrome P450 n=1 Tax=Chromera velia CCMP2878 TaxID=1169474 RepID=A0A0G4HIX2_9ALVE|mmetsp:Transcript_27839/g.54581  ORF Transcript_27839/g.54581 Transcript_27839/m.54581 type:complete len:603 (+) Transcript_27839:123-1931(+)|eukprot:Cvel_28088.t1-p1 / transcript=Cvel_28088.t1 / gene=Cvel_28088 / organism=Chromera_velia_CCMP2878 / gene_product=Cytochrome P450 86A1, putative / transcript_product=Cytochrome P450 86A1, putative / location=Cvel_scaffold3613:7159-10457(-) / protein_length=602 / sequence_SO=supercontig / SO=protein_coding / is_pseudo=false
MKFEFDRSSFAAVGGLAAAAAAGYYLYQNYVRKPNCPITPHVIPRAIPLVGNIVRALRAQSLDENVKDFEEAFPKETIAFMLPMQGWVVATVSPKNAEWILRTNFENYPKGPKLHDILEDFLGDGIFSTDEQIWRTHRKRAAPMFSLTMLRDFMFKVFVKHTNTMLEMIQEAADKGETVDMYSLLNRFTLECVGEIGFGTELGCLRDSDFEFMSAFDRANELSELRGWNPFWKILRLFNLGPEAMLRQDVSTLNRLSLSIVRERREELLRCDDDRAFADAVRSSRSRASRQLSKTSSMSGSVTTTVSSLRNSSRKGLKVRFTDENSEDGTIDDSSPLEVSKTLRPSTAETPRSHAPPSAACRDFLSLYMTADPTTTDSQLRDMVLNFLIAGKDTMSQAMSWALYELMQHPRVLQKAREEIKKAREETKGGDLNFEVTRNKLPYLVSVLHETLRLHPSVPRLFKTAKNDDYLPDGTFIPQGSITVVCAHTMGHLKSVWGEDAKEFRPERWMEMKSFPSSAKHVAFQAGPRECLGRHMAMLEMACAMSHLLEAFDFEPAMDLKECVPRSGLTLAMKNGLHVKVQRSGQQPARSSSERLVETRGA